MAKPPTPERELQGGRLAGLPEWVMADDLLFDEEHEDDEWRQDAEDNVVVCAS